MDRIFAGVDTGRKNIVFGIVLFLIYGVLIGIPLTVDLLGDSLLADSQFQAWKVLHAYGVFLAFVNFFFGYCIDRLCVSRKQKQTASWAFLVAALAGGIGRSVLEVLSLSGGIASYGMSLVETVGFVSGTLIFVRGMVMEPQAVAVKKSLTQITYERI